MKVSIPSSRSIVLDTERQPSWSPDEPTAHPAVSSLEEEIPFKLSRSKWESLSSTKRSSLRALAHSIRLVELRIAVKGEKSSAELPEIEWDTQQKSILKHDANLGRVQQENLYWT
uniref:Uncharacterized protein n=2 Tax=Guillardia theta (strain CCMP2712) TaxID=905079 RepID=A0A0C3SXN4_GUITC